MESVIVGDATGQKKSKDVGDYNQLIGAIIALAVIAFVLLILSVVFIVLYVYKNEGKAVSYPLTTERLPQKPLYGSANNLNKQTVKVGVTDKVGSSDVLELIISSFYAGADPNKMPLGFVWTYDLLNHFPGKYDITVMLHGETLKYGMKPDAYRRLFSENNPWKSTLRDLSEKGVKIVACELCIRQNGYPTESYLDFVKLVPFSVDYFASRQTKGAIVVYDAQLPPTK